MNKMVLKLSAIVTAIILFLCVGTVVLLTERSKKIEKYNTAKSDYLNSYNDWQTYQRNYAQEVLAIQKQNQEKMDQMQSQYNELLKQQPTLIAQKAVPILKTVTTPSQTQTVKKVVSTPAPQSKPVTRSS